jgi:isopenicillin-N epimerase
MEFFNRTYEPAWMSARERLARFVGTASENLMFVENATAGMNAVANSFPLHSEDEVLFTDHEYGAVLRIWQRACRAAGANEPRIAPLPGRIESAEQVVKAIFKAATERTRLLVVSHITSTTAIILPIKQICADAKQRGIAVCVDGPHAPAHVPLSGWRGTIVSTIGETWPSGCERGNKFVSGTDPIATRGELLASCRCHVINLTAVRKVK